MAIPCGHSFCGFCVEEFKCSINAGNAAECNHCRQPITSFNKNLLANSLLHSVQAECIWCGQKVQLDSSKGHIKECDRVEIPCEKCRKRVRKSHMDQHKLDECDLREIVCVCGTRVPKNEEAEHMRKVCSFNKEECPLKCGEAIERYVKVLSF